MYLFVTVISRLLILALLLTHFYGKKSGEDGQSSGNNSETPIDVEENDADLASVVKRRRVTAAQAQEERKQKEKEERIRYSVTSAEKCHTVFFGYFSTRQMLIIGFYTTLSTTWMDDLRFYVLFNGISVISGR